MAILSELILYPVKSCAGISVREATLTSAGLSVDAVYDREWRVVDPDGNCLTQREFTRMALISPRLRSDFPQYVVLNCARPVLVLPAKGAQSEIGRRVTVAWNGSSNAVRAIASALSVLQRAQAVDLVVFDADSDGDHHGDVPGADMALYLARHGIRVDVSSVPSGGDVGEALLSFAADKGADLIDMGAYGRSRFSEIVLGGASRTALLSSPVALWMAH